MRLRCDRCSAEYEWSEDNEDWAKECPVCGQLATWLTSAVVSRPEPKGPPNPFAVTAPVRSDAAWTPIICPPPSQEFAKYLRGEVQTPPYVESASPPLAAVKPPPLPVEPAIRESETS